MSPTHGRVEAIWTKRMKNGPMDPQQRVTMQAGRGIEGNADQKRKRQVTVLSAEAWRAAEAELGATVDPRARRANVLVSGVELANRRRAILRIGACRIEVYGETRPCRRMDEAHPGLQRALDPDWRGGVYGVVLDDTEIAVGDPVSWLED